MIEPYVEDLTTMTKENEFFRKVLFTGAHSQLVVMSLNPREEIGMEVHQVDQLLIIVEGGAKVVLDGNEQKFTKGMVTCVPAGVEHNIINTEDKRLQLFTIYAPPQHKAGTVQESKPGSDADKLGRYSKRKRRPVISAE